MKDFDYIILGGGLSGLSLAYELNRQGCLVNKTLCILEKRKEYTKDKNWSFWDFNNNKFENCEKKSWTKFSISANNQTALMECTKNPYRTIDSKKFYDFIIQELSKNKNVSLVLGSEIITINTSTVITQQGTYIGSFIFDSLLNNNLNSGLMYQHFYGCEIESEEDIFEEETVQLMDFNCEQINGMHFFYILPFSKRKALVETTWYSKNIKSLKEYQIEIDEYLLKKNIISKTNYTELGAIPLNLPPTKLSKSNYLKIGTAGNLTRMSTGYTFSAIQDYSEQLVKKLRLENIIEAPIVRKKKYTFLDSIFLSVIETDYKRMPEIFFNLFKKNSTQSTIKFLCDRSNFFEDIKIILSMPKVVFIKHFLIYLYKQLRNNL